MQDAAQILVADVQVEALQGNPYLLVGSPESAPAATQPSATNPATQLVVPEGMTRVEATIREVWMEVLKAEALGLDEDFFELGGHSLLGSMVVNRVVETFEVDLEFEDIFEYGTVRSLAAYVDSLLGEQASAVPEKQHPVAEAEGDFPLSQQQLGIWSVNAKHGDNDFYSIPYSFYLRDSIDATAMQGALEYMVARHASLRTVFSLTTDGPIQRVQEKAPVDLELVDLTGEADPHAVMQLQIQELYKHPFSIEQGPLCQFKLFQLEAKVWVLSSNFHHIICDAISLSKIFFPELQQAYQALVQGQPVPLAPLAVSYAEYALDQQARFAQGELDEHRTFWQQKRGGRGQLSALPMDFDRPETYTYDGDAHRVVLSPEVTEQLEHQYKHAGVSEFQALVAGFFAWLRRYGQQDHVRLGTTISHRSELRYEPVIGLFAGQMVLAEEVSLTETLGTLLAQTRQTILDSFRHKEFTTESILEELDLGVDMTGNRHPLFDIMFNWHDVTFEQSVESLDETSYDVRGISKFDLEIHGMRTVDGGTEFFFGYNTNLFKPETIARMAEDYKTTLEDLAADPATAINAIEMQGDELGAEAQSVDDLFDF